MRQGVFNPKLKLLWHCERLIDWKAGKNIAPIMVEMDLTNRCQLNCNFCTFRYLEDKSDIRGEVASMAISDMASAGVKAINFTGGGEPTLHPSFSFLVATAVKCWMNVGVFTNGFSLTDKICEIMAHYCSWVRISIDAATEETFFKIKGVVGLKRTLDNVKKLCAMKKYSGGNADIGVGFVITPENYHEIYDFAKLFEDMPEIRYIQFKPMIDNCFESSNIEKEWWKEKVEPILQKTMKDFPRTVINYYKFNDITSDIERDYDVCYGHQFCPCIGATGDLWVCTHLRGFPEYSFGNLNDKSFQEIWQSEKRQQVISAIDLTKCQKYCRNNEINKVLYQLKTPDVCQHTNFI